MRGVRQKYRREMITTGTSGNYSVVTNTYVNDILVNERTSTNTGDPSIGFSRLFHENAGALWNLKIGRESELLYDLTPITSGGYFDSVSGAILPDGGEGTTFEPIT